MEASITLARALNVTSNAISVAVRLNASRWLRMAYGAMLCLCLLIAAAELIKAGDEISLAMRFTVVSTAFVAAVLCASQLCKGQIDWDIFVTGTGEIHLAASSRQTIECDSPTKASLNKCILAPGSLITTVLLVLRLADNHGKIKTLLVFPDSVSKDAFRRLSIACRWIAAQKKASS